MAQATPRYGIRFKQEADVWMNADGNMGSKVLCILFDTAELAQVFLKCQSLRRGFRQYLSVQPISPDEIREMRDTATELAKITDKPGADPEVWLSRANVLTAILQDRPQAEPKQYKTFPQAARSKEARAFRRDLQAIHTADIEAVKARYEVIMREAEEAHVRYMKALEGEQLAELAAASRADRDRDREWFAARLPKEAAA